MSVRQVRDTFVAKQGNLVVINKDRAAAVSRLTVLVWRGR